VHDTDDPSLLSFSEKRSSIVFRIPGVNDNGHPHFGGDSYLGGKRRALGLPRGIVVVVVEPALPDCNGAAKKLAKSRDIARLVESGRVMGMNAGSREDEARVFGGACRRENRHLERLSDAHDSRRARIAGAGDYRVAVAVERRVCEVGVAVDEVFCREPVWRGHLRSIQRSTGAAT
jgi:hypothetical protein